MPTEADRNELAKAIEDKDTSKIREFLQRDDAKELLLMRDAEYGHLPIHGAYRYELDETCFQLIFDTAVEHGIIRQMLGREGTKWLNVSSPGIYQRLRLSVSPPRISGEVRRYKEDA